MPIKINNAGLLSDLKFHFIKFGKHIELAAGERLVGVVE